VLQDLYIDNKTICCVPTEYNIYLIFVLDNTTGWPQSKKKKKPQGLLFGYKKKKKKNTLKINFTYFGNNEIYCIFKTCCKICFIFN